MDKQLLKLLEQKRKNAYADPQSIFRKYDCFLEENGVYHSFNEKLFFDSIKNKGNLCEFTLSIYFEATYDNEKEFLLNCLLHMGYDRNSLVELVLDLFKKEKQNKYLWHYADFLYSLKNYEYLDDYIKLIMDKSYGSSREMLILLVGESRMDMVIPYLIELSNDNSVIGHVLTALSHYDDGKITTIMKKHINHPQKWISDIANKYLQKRQGTVSVKTK